MIKYTLVCEQGCEFDAWFRCAHTFEVQEASRQIECPHCGTHEIQKSVTTPCVARPEPEQLFSPRRTSIDEDASQAEIAEVLRRFRAEVAARSGQDSVSETRAVSEDDSAILLLRRLSKDRD